MKNRYQVEINDAPAKAFKTIDRAVSFAQRILDRHPTQVTTAGLWDSHEYEAVVRDMKTGRIVDRGEAPVVIVPSVGDVGYW